MSTEEDENSTNTKVLYVVTRIIPPIIFSLIVIVGLFGNLLVIIVVCVNKNLRNCTNILIASLATADLAFLIFCAPMTAAIYVNMGWTYGPIICQIFIYFTYLTAYMSVYTLVLMSLDRYLAVVHPVVSITIRTEYNALKVVIITWLSFGCTNLPLLINSAPVYPPSEFNATNSINSTNSPKQFYCSYLPMVTYNKSLNGYIENFSFAKNYYILFFLFGFCLPLLVIIILYSFLIFKLLYNPNTTVEQSSRALKSKKRVTRMVVIVIIIFALCWLPIQTVFILQVFNLVGDNLAFRIFHILANSLAYSNSMVNPILYAFFSTNFRMAFKSILLCIWDSNSNNRNMGGAREFEKTHANFTKETKEQNMTVVANTDVSANDKLMVNSAMNENRNS